LQESRNTALQVRILRGGGAREHTDRPHPVRLLRENCERPRRRTPQPRDELSPLQPIEMH